MKTNYNRSNIMTNAWTIRRGSKSNMSAALTLSWKIEKLYNSTVSNLPEMTAGVKYMDKAYEATQVAKESEIRVAALQIVRTAYVAYASRPDYAANAERIDSIITNAMTTIAAETNGNIWDAYAGILNGSANPAAVFDRIMSDIRSGKLANRAEAAAKAETKSSRPACIPEGRWNGKIYGGTRKGYSIYVNGNKIDLTDEEAAAVQAYIAT